jgi:hypothetical protein
VLNTHPHLSAEVMKGRAIPLSTRWAFLAFYRENLYFYPLRHLDRTIVVCTTDEVYFLLTSAESRNEKFYRVLEMYWNSRLVVCNRAWVVSDVGSGICFASS